MRYVGLLLALASIVGAGEHAPEWSVWYRFDAPETLGRSGGTPWPACAFRAELAEGKVGDGLRVEGRGATGLMLPNPASFFGDEARRGTIALWVKPDFDPAAETGQRCIIDFMVRAGNSRIDGYEIVILTDGDKLVARAALRHGMKIPTPLKQGEWTHLVLTWDADVGSILYVNGKQAAERKGKFKPTALTTWPGRLGAHTPGGGYPFKGTLDELRLLNRMVTPAEVVQLAGAGEATPRLKVDGWDGTVLRVTNQGDATVAVRVREWQVEMPEGADVWGKPPLPEGEFGSEPVYVAGVARGTWVSRANRLAPGQMAGFDLPARGGYVRALRRSVLVGEGLACREALGRDYRGLVCEVEPKALLTGAPPTVRLRVCNDSGRAFAGTLSGTVVRNSGEVVARLTELPVRLRVGRSTDGKLRLARQPLGVGAYILRPVATTEAGERCVLRAVRLYVTPREDYRTLVGVGAAYTQHPPPAELLERMAADGVKVLRRGPRAQWHEATTVEPYGFKMWYTTAWSSRRICVARMAEAERLAAKLGACHKGKLTLLNQVMCGEGLGRPPCYCDACNAAFRAWLRKKYRRIERLNEAWGSDYKAFDAIHQLGSPEDVSHAATRMELMQRKLPKHHQKRWAELFRLDPTRGIEWKRWHDGVLVEFYRRFARAYHKTNRHATALSEQPCWPNFKHHVLFALGDIADLGGMDLYLPGELPTTLGYAAELMCNFDMNASIFQGKPLWLHELYVQDNSPPGLAEAQGWWLAGRGYQMLTYFTYSYYYEGVRARLPLIFGMFDKENKPYPCYESFARFSRELSQFHREHDVLALRRETPRVAMFLSDDTSMANRLETGGATWGAAGVTGHVGAYWLVERNGFPVEFLNDDGLGRLGDYRVVVVPWTHVVRQKSLERVMRFARRGGTVIFDGPAGLRNELYRPYARKPGGGALKALGIQVADIKDEVNEVVLAPSQKLVVVKAATKIAARGVPVGVEPGECEVVAKDAKGSPALLRRRIGRGQVFVSLTSLGRMQRSRAPDPNAVALWGAMLGSAGIRSHHSFVADGGTTGAAAGADLDHGGKGVKQNAPLCDVAVRLKGKHDLFVFVVNFFAASKGTVTLRLAKGRYIVSDAVSHEPVEFARVGDGYRFDVELPAFGAKVVHVRCTSGRIAWQ